MTQHHAYGGHAQGEPFGPYEVYERLGVGGMATVHRAVERGIEGFERVVALKRLLPHLAEDADFVRSFVREAKLASQLQHINICQLYELGRVGAVYFISMEYIEGRDVRQLLRQARRTAGPPPVDVTVSILAELCDALDYAHHCTDDKGDPLGLVHRDVSPSNLLLAGSGHVKIIDFGIAKATSQKLRTQTGRVKGKLAYMSPEAIRGARLDARSDIFSVGVIAHELLTATPLFASKNDYETLTKIQQKDVERPSTVNPKVPRELDDLVLRALAKNPDERFASAGEFRDALDELRMRHGLNATNRAVKAWVGEAFAGGVAEPGGRTRRPSDASLAAPRSRPISASPVAVSPVQDAERDDADGASSARGSIDAGDGSERASSAAGELGAGAEPESAEVAESSKGGDDDVVDIAWGDDEGAPVILDEVPDVSHKVPMPPSPPPDAMAAGAADADDAELRPGASPTGSGAAVAAAGVAEADADGDDEEDAPTRMALASGGGADRVSGMGLDRSAEEPGDVEQPKVWPEGTNPREESGGAEPAEERAARSRRAPTSIGMTIVSRDRGIKRRVAIGGAVAVVVAVAVGSLFAAGGDDAPVAGGASDAADAGAAAETQESAQAATGARLTFSVQPEDAEILIDDEPLDQEELPYVVERPAGTYRIEIRKDGYESWVKTMEVAAGESHVLHKRLDPGGNEQAVLKVASTPQRLRVKVDGEVLGRTPLRVEIEPGARAVEVAGPGDEWRERFDAEADTVYSFHPVFGERERREARRTARRSRRGTPSSPGDDGSSESTAPAGLGFVDDSRGSSLAPLPIEVDAPPEREQEESAPATREPKMVSGADVDRVAGGGLALPPGARVEALTVELCLDESGRVDDVDTISSVGVDIERALRRSVMNWRFRPYTEGGSAVPVCFRQTFSLH